MLELVQTLLQTLLPRLLFLLFSRWRWRVWQLLLLPTPLLLISLPCYLKR